VHLDRDTSLTDCVDLYVKDLLASKASLLGVLIQLDFKNGGNIKKREKIECDGPA